MDIITDFNLSLVRGIPLNEEPGLGPLTLPGFLQDVTQRFAEREALVLHHGEGTEDRWTYAELRHRAMQVAQALMACGIGKDSRVGVLMTNRPEFLSAVFGAALAGAVAVPLSTFSTQAELAYLLQASCVSILLFEGQVLKKDFTAALVALVPEIACAEPGALVSLKFPYLRHLAVLGESFGGAIESWPAFLARGQPIAPAHVQARADAVKPADPGLLLFSSGSTGKPKGVLSSHRGVCIQCWRWRRLFALGDNVRIWGANGFFWSGNFGMGIGGALSSGGALVLQRYFDPAEALHLMQAERVTLVLAWPHQWAQLTAAPNWESVDLSSLIYVDAETPLAQHKTVSTTWREPAHAYGNTETFTLVTAFPANTPIEITGHTHGEPLPGCTIKIVAPLTGETLPRGARGEIAVKGPTLMLGYIGTPIDETLDAEGFFRTNDGGFIDDRGRLIWEGRLNDIVKTGGANVSPIEIDAVLATCPGIKMAQTVGVPHDLLGEMVVSCVVPHAGHTLREEEVRAFVKQHLASYKIPRRVLFVDEAELSLTGSGKVKTSELRGFAVKTLAAEPAAV